MLRKIRKGWYVLYVRSCQEKKVHSLLNEMHLESYLPLVSSVRQWSDRKKTILKPLFPSYVFVKVNNPRDFTYALSAYGACDYIRFGHDYAQVKEKEMHNIKLFVEAGELEGVQTCAQTFETGQVRTINYGPLSGLECEVVRINNTKKIIVRIDSLQQNITATMPAYYLSETLAI